MKVFLLDEGQNRWIDSNLSDENERFVVVGCNNTTAYEWIFEKGSQVKVVNLWVNCCSESPNLTLQNIYNVFKLLQSQHMHVNKFKSIFMKLCFLLMCSLVFVAGLFVDLFFLITIKIPNAIIQYADKRHAMLFTSSVFLVVAAKMFKKIVPTVRLVNANLFSHLFSTKTFKRWVFMQQLKNLLALELVDAQVITNSKINYKYLTKLNRKTKLFEAIHYVASGSNENDK